MKIQTATSSNRSGAVQVGRIAGQITCIRFAPNALGRVERAEEFRALFRRAAAKLRAQEVL